MRIQELRERQAQVVVEARERLDLVTANTDESRAAELEASHDAARVRELVLKACGQDG